ncbi:MAG: sodium-translocating pyrophosphatase [Candidatus Diapherotrites archaeon]|uniref:K(+)-insensitive pyrophosphate-energized proton pump n=3 Tax=Candidatus Iainarchaeum sp. TaxID=3101447 RepID=A0A8T4LA18_9ARCH|nr:sodium-translocating pyrophosphatase [Candidatus Diapherotrites archaeon]
MELILLVFAISVLSVGFAGYLANYVLKKDTGTPKMREISNAIMEGANAFLKRQYKTIAVICVVLAVLIMGAYALTGKVDFGLKTAVAFVFGAFCSALSGYIGMWISIRANIRAASGAQRSLNEALTIALRGGAVSGIIIVALSLLGVSALYYFYGLSAPLTEVPFLIVGFGFGASFVALFAQLGGGIYTKAADVGADLVGKVEAGIPEDDPRNPAVIADLVGDNVGDCAGRGADLFESTAAENIGAMILGVALFPVFGVNGIVFPLVARAFGLIASIIGIMAVKAREDEDPMNALNRGYLITSVLAAIAFYIATQWLLGNILFFYAGLVGILASIAFVYITIYYTDQKYGPVKSIAEASKTGHATNIIAGFGVGLECVAAPVIVLSAALMGSFMIGELSGYANGGLYGTAIATMGMLSTAAFVLAMDTFGPITDNAGGIVEMSKSPEKVRKITDRLDAVGNTTKALTKGYAVGSAGLAAFLLFTAYMDEVTKLVGHPMTVNLAKVDVFVGGLLGAMLVFLFSSYAIKAVGKTAGSVIEEVRRQFREIPGLMKGKAKPDYAKCVDICTTAALKEMVLPGLLVVFMTLAVGYVLKAEAAAAFLMVGTMSGILMALLLNTGGGAWDNAKKYIETGAFGGKGSEAHKAAVTGDTVGDPFKDTAGPSLHVLIKLLGTLTLVLAPLFI